VRQAFVFEGIAVVVGPWHEPMDPPERGTRVEVRLLDAEPKRGSRFAAERVVLDAPMFRADLFDQVTSPPGNLKAAHFHSRFNGIEPTDRIWDEAIQADATGWLAGELSDLPALLSRSGLEIGDHEWVEGDAKALRDAVPEIVAAVEATWAAVRAE
jgi:hypothetical protein